MNFMRSSTSIFLLAIVLSLQVKADVVVEYSRSINVQYDGVLENDNFFVTNLNPTKIFVFAINITQDSVVPFDFRTLVKSMTSISQSVDAVPTKFNVVEPSKFPILVGPIEIPPNSTKNVNVEYSYPLETKKVVGDFWFPFERQLLYVFPLFNESLEYKTVYTQKVILPPYFEHTDNTFLHKYRVYIWGPEMRNLEGGEWLFKYKGPLNDSSDQHQVMAQVKMDIFNYTSYTIDSRETVVWSGIKPKDYESGLLEGQIEFTRPNWIKLVFIISLIALFAGGLIAAHEYQKVRNSKLHKMLIIAVPSLLVAISLIWSSFQISRPKILTIFDISLLVAVVLPIAYAYYKNCKKQG